MYPSLGLPTILPQSITNSTPRFPNIEASSLRSHTLTDAEGPRQVPVTYAGDTFTLEGGSRSTGALKIVRVRSPANNRLLSAARQMGPHIRTPRRSSPLAALFLRGSSRFATVAHPALALHAASNTLPVLFYLLVCSFGLGLVRSVSPFTSWGPSLRTNTFRGRTFPFLRVCRLLPLPLLGHGTCHWVHSE